MIKKITLFLFLSVLFIFRIEAAMVSFMIIETGLPLEGEKKLHSEHWENSIFDIFFDSGHITTNAPMLRFTSITTERIDDFIKEELFDAREGGADFFLLVQLDYEPGVLRPHEISFFIYKINPFMNIYVRRLAGKTYRTVKDEADDINSIIRGLIPQFRN